MAAPRVPWTMTSRKRLLAGAGIHQHAVAAIEESGGDRGVPLHRPALGAPARAGIDERQRVGSLPAPAIRRTMPPRPRSPATGTPPA